MISNIVATYNVSQSQRMPPINEDTILNRRLNTVSRHEIGTLEESILTPVSHDL